MRYLDIEVEEWMDDLTCPRCLRKDTSKCDGFSMWHIVGTEILFTYCRRCGFNFLMKDAGVEEDK